MHKLIVMYPEPDDPQGFIEYYEAHHVPLAAKLPGLLSQSYGRPNVLGGQKNFFLIWEGVFADRDSLFAALRSEVGAKVAADVPNYSPKGAAMLEMEEISY
jgi:uncharacterized protein (TIGR02118 family)